MPNLTAFLEEWGVSPQAGLVAETDSGNMVVSDSTGVLVTPTDEILGDNSYDRLVSYYSAPLEVLFEPTPTSPPMSCGPPATLAM